MENESRHIFFGRFVGQIVKRSGRARPGKVSGFLYDASTNRYRVGVISSGTEIYIDEDDFLKNFETVEEPVAYL